MRYLKKSFIIDCTKGEETLIKKHFIFIIILMFFLILSSGCTNSNDKAATISVNSDSEYVSTFEALNLGVIYDFDFKLPHANKRLVNLWVERYDDGNKASQPLVGLSYGSGTKEVEEGHLGFGMIDANMEDTLVFLYAPGVSAKSSEIEKESKAGIFSSWEYGIGNKEVELDLNETKILAAYRETESNSIRTIDLQDEEAVKRMIKQDDIVFLLKIKIEEINN